VGNPVTVIDIVTQVTDNTEAGAKSATKTVSKLEQTMKKIQQEITRMRGMSKLELAMTLKDKVTSGLAKIGSKIKSVAGKVWSVTVGIVDKVTAACGLTLTTRTGL
jgi:hypothetical protein